MCLFIVPLVALVAVVSCAPAPQYDAHEYRTSPIPILKHNYDQHHGGYQFSYETGNGIQAKEQGFIKNKGDKERETLVQQGTITYHDEQGRPITLSYIADEHGFQPQGAHLPTPPPLPHENLKALAAIARPQQQQPEYYQQVVPQHQHTPQVHEEYEGGHEYGSYQ